MSLDTLIADTRNAIAGDAANAQAVFTAQGTLVGVTEVDIRTGAHTFKVDEPPALGGADAAANPVQYALASLGSCQAITYRFWAAQLGVELDSITVRVEGDLTSAASSVSTTGTAGLFRVRVEVTVAGPESEERYAELAAAVDEHCPVLDLFRTRCRCRARSSSWIPSRTVDEARSGEGPPAGRTNRGLVPSASSSQAEDDVVEEVAVVTAAPLIRGVLARLRGQRGVAAAVEDERGGRGGAGLDVPDPADHDLVVAAAGQAVSAPCTPRAASTPVEPGTSGRPAPVRNAVPGRGQPAPGEADGQVLLPGPRARSPRTRRARGWPRASCSTRSKQTRISGGSSDSEVTALAVVPHRGAVGADRRDHRDAGREMAHGVTELRGRDVRARHLRRLPRHTQICPSGLGTARPSRSRGPYRPARQTSSQLAAPTA